MLIILDGGLVYFVTTMLYCSPTRLGGEGETMKRKKSNPTSWPIPGSAQPVTRPTLENACSHEGRSSNSFSQWQYRRQRTISEGSDDFCIDGATCRLASTPQANPYPWFSKWTEGNRDFEPDSDPEPDPDLEKLVMKCCKLFF